MAWSDPVRLTKTSADLTPATGARTTRFCRPQAALRQEVLRTVHVRQNVCEAGYSAVRPARLDRSQPKPPCDQTSAPDAAASTASRPNVRDDGQRPSSRAGIAEVVMLIWVKREAIYFCARDWTDSITLNGRERFVFARMRDWRERSVSRRFPAPKRKAVGVGCRCG